MSDYNHAGISGRLTRDSELRTVGEQSLLEFGLASNKKYKDKEKEKTTFIDVVLWGRQAESLAPYLKKGKYVMVGGELQYESWVTDGVKKSKLVLNANTVDMTPRNAVDFVEADESTTVTKCSTGLPEESDMVDMADVPF